MEDYNSKIWGWERDPVLAAKAKELERHYWKFLDLDEEAINETFTAE